MNFYEWIEFGQSKGWVSEIVCATHDGLPSSPAEELEWEDGGDPCEPSVRVWSRKITGCDVCGVGPEDKCNDECTIERT